MTFLEAAEAIAAQIPDDDAYREERAFCWTTLGRTALAVGDEELLRRSIATLGESMPGAELRLAVLDFPALRSELVAEFFGRFEFWEDYLYRRGVSDLAGIFSAEYGVARAAEAAERIVDPFSRTTFLVTLAEGTRDMVLKRSLLDSASRAAARVDGDFDYAMRWVGSGYVDAGMLEEAREIGNALRAPHIRIDYLEQLSKHFEAIELVHDADQLEAERAEIIAERPGLKSESEILQLAADLLTDELPGAPPTDARVWADVTGLFASGAIEEGLKLARERFPTRLCPVVLAAPESARDNHLLFQLAAILPYHRNDLKVEFLCNLAFELHCRNQAEPAAVLEVATSAAFRALEPAAAWSIDSKDPSQLDFDAFIRHLFDRPVHETEEERRFMERDSDNGGYVHDSVVFVGHATRLFGEFGRIAPSYSPAQVDQAMWGLHSYPFRLNDYFDQRDPEIYDIVPEDDVIACIHAGYHVFADYVAIHEIPDTVTYFHMWWDELWRELSPAVANALIEAMDRVLAIEDDSCRYAALHGLNHLPHSHVEETIDRFLAANEGNLSDEMMRYALQCRGQSAM